MEEFDLVQVFDEYVLKFLGNFPMIEIERQPIGKDELMVKLIIKEPEHLEYTIHIKKV